MKASITTFDENEKPDGDGMVEEFSDGAGRSRTITTYRGATKTAWKTPKASYVEGEQFPRSFFEREVTAGFFAALPSATSLSELQLEEHDRTVGGTQLHCVTTKQKLSEGPSTAAQMNQAESAKIYCMTAGSHILRLEESFPRLAMIYNGIEVFGSRQVARSISLSEGKTVRARFEVETLETWKPDEQTFVPSPAALAKPAKVAAAVMVSVVPIRLISQSRPAYPLEAKRLRVQGTVVLSATISREGTVKDLEVVDSPDPSLTAAAMDSVKTWRYQPLMVAGQPSETQTLIKVNFSFSSSVNRF